MHSKDTFFLNMPHSFPDIHDCIPIGKIARTHGNEGFVLVNLSSDYNSVCKEIEYVLLEIQHKLVPFFIQSCKTKGGATYIQFDDITTTQLAETICGYTLFVPSNLITEQESENHTHELLGYSLHSDKEYIGAITDVMEYSMNVVLAVETSNNQEILIPFSSELLIEIDSENKKLTLIIPDGILDLE